MGLAGFFFIIFLITFCIILRVLDSSPVVDNMVAVPPSPIL